MALLLGSGAAPQLYPSLLETKRGNFLHHQHHTFSHLLVRSQDTSASSSSPSSEDTSSSSSSSGVGFGSSTDTRPVPKPKKQKQKGGRERASVIRRAPVEVPKFGSQRGDDEDAAAAGAKQLRQNESAFLLAWLGLGGIILAQGIILAASGFLPEQWDGFFVKYLYPSFTPTVFLFVAGTVAYGVFKYLQNEKFNQEN